MNFYSKIFSEVKANIQPCLLYAGKRLEEGEGLNGLEGVREVLSMSSTVMKWVVWGNKSTGWITVGRKGSPSKLPDVARPRSTKFLGMNWVFRITH